MDEAAAAASQADGAGSEPRSVQLDDADMQPAEETAAASPTADFVRRTALSGWLQVYTSNPLAASCWHDSAA